MPISKERLEAVREIHFKHLEKVLAEYKRGIITPTEFFAETAMNVREIEDLK